VSALTKDREYIPAPDVAKVLAVNIAGRLSLYFTEGWRRVRTTFMYIMLTS